MKKIKILTALLLFVSTGLSLIACANNDQKAAAYGVVHNHYVAKVVISKRDGKISKVSINEAELPYSWARTDMIKTTIATVDTVTNSAYTGSGTNRTYAKKIIIGDVIFTARDNGTANNYVDYYNQDKNNTASFENWLTIETNAEWYYNNISDGNFDILKNDETAYNVDFVDSASGALDKSKRWLKSENGYWAEDQSGLGWTGNIKAISDYVIANGLEDYIALDGGEIERDSNDEYIINDIKTGATLIDFEDYMRLIVAAYNKI